MATSIRLPILKASDTSQTDSIDAELETFMREESLRLGLSLDPRSRTHWVDKMTTPTVKKSERDNLQILVTGLTPAQDYFVEAGLSGLGYNVRWIGTANQSALQVGKEFGNRGQCNPTHFTVGNLVQELIRREDFDADDPLRVRLFDGRCMRPMSLRHVRHRVPQGAS